MGGYCEGRGSEGIPEIGYKDGNGFMVVLMWGASGELIKGKDLYTTVGFKKLIKSAVDREWCTYLSHVF